MQLKDPKYVMTNAFDALHSCKRIARAYTLTCDYSYIRTLEICISQQASFNFRHIRFTTYLDLRRIMIFFLLLDWIGLKKAFEISSHYTFQMSGFIKEKKILCRARMISFSRPKCINQLPGCGYKWKRMKKYACQWSDAKRMSVGYKSNSLDGIITHFRRKALWGSVKGI